MDTAVALDFLEHNHHAVLGTHRRSGDMQLSPVLAVPWDGRVLISTREGAVKIRNLRRRPRASLCVLPETFFGNWVQITGGVEIISLPEAMEVLIEYYRRANGEHDDWDEYQDAMRRERRCALVISPDQVGPSISG